MGKLEALLCLNELRGVGTVSINRICQQKSDIPEDLLEIKKWIKQVLPQYSENEINAALQRTDEKINYLKDQSEINTITIFDNNYPVKLNDLKDRRPVILYCMGNISLIGSNNVAVVGTRKPCNNSVIIENQIVEEIVNLSICVTSGLALGCDTTAHGASIAAGGKTIAVLPSGFEQITPAENSRLIKEIIKHKGLIISEYFPTSKATKSTFIERDRIIAGLAGTTVVIECRRNSGTMHTADYALEYGRKLVCYIPDNNKLIDIYEGNYYLVNNKVGSFSTKEDFLLFINKTAEKENFNQISFDFTNLR